MFENQSTPLGNKKFFLQWFLNFYTIKDYKIKWLLGYILRNDDLLTNLRFIEHAKYCPRAIILQVKESQQVVFQFQKGGVITSDVEKSFHDLRLTRKTPMFMQIDFSLKSHPPHYLQVLEVNPYILQQDNDSLQIDGLKRKKEQFFTSLYEKQIDQLKVKIDKALDANDQKRFFQLTEQLLTIKSYLK